MEISVTPPLSPPSPDSSPPSFATVLENKIVALFIAIIRPLADLLNRQFLALKAAGKILQAALFNWLYRVYEILFTPLSDFLDRLAYGRTIAEVLAEVQIAQAKQAENSTNFALLADKFNDPGHFIEDLKELKKLNQEITQNIERLTASAPEEGISYSIEYLVHEFFKEKISPEEEINNPPNENIGPTNENTRPKLVIDILDETLKEDRALSKKLDAFWKTKLPSLLATFEKFMKAQGEEKKIEILSTWRDLTSQLPNSLKHSYKSTLEKIENEIRSFLKINIETEERPSLEASIPVNKVRNIGNSCYIACVLQAILAVPSLREQIARPLPLPNSSALIEGHGKKLAIQQALLKFMSPSSKNSEEDEKCFLYPRAPLYKLREAIFNSSFNDEFKQANLERQLDAASVLELLSEVFFENCKFEMSQAIRLDQDMYPNIEIHLKKEPYFILQIPLDEHKQTHDFKDLVNLVYKEREATKFHLNPGHQDMRSIDPTQPFNLPTEAKMIEQYKIRSSSLEPAPAILLTHFKRFKQIEYQGDQGTKCYDRIKIGDEVELTKDGVFSLPPSASSGPVTYQLKSFVVHEGVLTGGHYTSYVEMQGKYYFCDDRLFTCYREVNQADFLSASKHSYLCIWEQLPLQA